MVVGSLAVRSRLDESSDGGGGGNDGSGGGALRLVCSTELGPVCEAIKGKDLTVSVEPAATTAARLSTDDAGGPSSIDGWLVPSPWPEIVQASRQRAGLEPRLEAGPTLARSPLVLAVWPDKLNVLRPRCSGQVSWQCWGEVSGQPAAQIKPGHADVNEAVGLATVGAATAGFFGRADLVRADLEENDQYRSWLARLEKAVPTFQPSSGTAVRDMLVKGPAAFDAVATTEAEAAPLVATAARLVKPMVIYPSPVTTVDVVLATVPGSRSKRLSAAAGGDDGLDALAAAGWRVAKRRPADGIPSQPELPPSSGLPDAGILEFLRTLSKEVTK